MLYSSQPFFFPIHVPNPRGISAGDSADRIFQVPDKRFGTVERRAEWDGDRSSRRTQVVEKNEPLKSVAAGGVLKMFKSTAIWERYPTLIL